MPQQGPVKQRWAAHHARSRRAVMARCRGRCEACGIEGAPLDWAHLFGRRHVVGEPWASSPELTSGLCRPCHRAADGLDPELRRDLRMAAAVRFARAHGLEAPSPLSDPYDAVLGMVRTLEQQG